MQDDVKAVERVALEKVRGLKRFEVYLAHGEISEEGGGEYVRFDDVIAALTTLERTTDAG